MRRIPAEEAVFDVRFAADDNGRLFRWGGELHRAIPLDRAEFCRDLFAKGIVQELVAKGLLVETALAPCELEGFGAILRHSTIPFVSYPHEWCGAMLRDAALLTLDLEIELCRNGLTLQDGHPWNVLFQGAEGRFVDFGSIGPASPGSTWVAHDEFCRFFLHPLLLIQHGYGRIARALLHDDIGVTRSELLALVPDAPPARRELIRGSGFPACNVCESKSRPSISLCREPTGRTITRAGFRRSRRPKIGRPSTVASIQRCPKPGPHPSLISAPTGAGMPGLPRV